MKRRLAGVAWLTIGCATVAGAQSFTRKEPAVYPGTALTSPVTPQPPGIRLRLPRAGEFALAPLNEAETARLAEPGTLLRVGIHRTLPPAALSTGAWGTTSDGGRVWRMAIRSPGSEGIRVEFRNFSVGSGKVWLHDGSQVAGPYSGRGLYDDGHFWSATVFSESVTLEYEPEAGAPADAGLPFEIRGIAHRGRRPVARRLFGDAPQAGSTDPADYCQLDPNCFADWKPAMSMVAELLFEDSGSEYACSGSAIATRDDSFIPYLLTAGHCIHSEAAARSLETFWTYQTASCGGPPPASRDTSAKSTVGAHLIGSGGLDQGDYSLVLLKDVPAGVTFAGWDMADPPTGASLTGIHHPKGSWKRISFGARTTDATAQLDGALAPADRYLQVIWAQGRTEPGSSGSPLFSSPGVIVGTLTYGPTSPTLSACEITPSIAGYARFSNAYLQLRDYLENLPAAEVKPAPSDVRFTVANQKASPAQTVNLTTQSPGQIDFKLRADAPWIRLSPVTGTLSQNGPAQVQISVDPTQFDQPDLYTGTVTILSGAAAPRFINVTADVRATQSNVQVSITPSPVVSANGQWQFTISLTETAGVATRVAAIRINGVDYSSFLSQWFGADHIDGNGSLQATLTATGVLPNGSQYFEFWGADDETGRPWYRVISARFQ
jgi:trypsin-like peptidase/BACON domain-containing protein